MPSSKQRSLMVATFTDYVSHYRSDTLRIDVNVLELVPAGLRALPMAKAPMRDRAREAFV